jgi:DDE superfamily endonuclease
MSLIDLYYLIIDDNRPNSLIECRRDDDGSVDNFLYMRYLEKQSELQELERNRQDEIWHDEGDGSVLSSSSSSRKKRRTVKSLRPYYFDENGVPVYLQPRQTVWYFMYVTGPALDSKHFLAKFRRRFRMPYAEYQRLLSKVKQDNRFARWNRSDAVGLKASPVELLLLGTLRYLGRGLTFDDLEEYTAISEETHRVFFHEFIDFGATVLHAEMVQYPTDRDQGFSNHVDEFYEGGFNGCGFSTDATNVIMWRCQHNLKQANMGFKQSHPARTYNMTCNHRREILYTTKGHPSRYNDKTLAYTDEFLQKIKSGEILSECKFELYSKKSDGTLVSTKYRGAWGLVDNGYHKWSFLQAPAKHHNTRDEHRFSQWLESFRKDAKCTFGILKGRFRVLKTGIRVEGTEAADKVWLTCCALHNWLLRSDGLADKWTKGVASDYQGELGENDPNEMRQISQVPFAIARLNDASMRSFGSEQHLNESVHEETVRRRLEGQLDENVEVDEEQPETIQTAEDGGIYIRTLSYDDFRRRLVEHFTIQFHRGRVKWPRRNSLPVTD